jgi:hypothetical protein
MAFSWKLLKRIHIKGNFNLIPGFWKRSYMTSQTKLTKDLIFKMLPQVTTKFNGRSKRALSPFVGNIASNLFGVATIC